MGIVAVIKRKSLGLFKIFLIGTFAFISLAFGRVYSAQTECYGSVCTPTSNNVDANNILSFVSIPDIPSQMVIGDPAIIVSYTITSTSYAANIVTNYEGASGEISRLSNDSCHQLLPPSGKCEIKLKISPDPKQSVPRVLSLQLKISANAGKEELNEDAPHLISVISGVPTITAQPQSQTITTGNPVTLSVVAQGSGTLHYQWYHEAAPTGSDSANFSLSKAQLSDAGSYTVKVSNQYGSITSNSATLTIGDAPKLIVQPHNIDTSINYPVTLAVKAEGTGELSYQWYQGEVEVGKNSPVFALDKADLSNSGIYKVVVSNTFGKVTSDSVTLSITDLPAVRIKQSNRAVTLNSKVVFNTIAETGERTE